MQVGIITISDRASRDEYPDLSGPALRNAVERAGWSVICRQVVADEIPLIQQAVREQIKNGAELILAAGGTGIAPRDVTPEAIRAIASRELPGFGEVMRSESLKVTPHAILSRTLAAVVERSLVVCLPGSPKAAVECLGFVLQAIPHCIQMLRGDTAH